MIRSNCEGLITLKYIKANFKNHKNELIFLLARQENYARLLSQESFLKEHKPEQIILNTSIFGPYKPTRKRLKEIIEDCTGSKKGKLPPVETMAKEVGFKDVYDYIYTGSSDMVHFRVAPLMRMGWSKSKEEKYTFRFSTSNFKGYYDAFLKFYSAYLFIEFSNHFKNELKLKGNVWKSIKLLKTEMLNIFSYPELITFEELNLKRPSRFLELTLRLAKKYP